MSLPNLLNTMCVLGLTLSCNSSSPELSKFREDIDTSHPTCDTYTSKKFAEPQKEASSEIYKILDSVPGECSKKDPQDSGPCERVTIKFEAKQAKKSSRGQRIMLIDSGFQIPAMLRYAPRVLDILEHEESSGNYHTSQKTLRTYKAVKEIYHDLIGGKYIDLPGILFSEIIGERGWEGPIEKINAIGDTLLFEGETEISDHWSSHGAVILNKLASYNPHAEFVLVDDTESSQTRKNLGIDICKIEEDPSIIKKYRKFTQEETSSLIRSINKYEVNFLSLSSSFSLTHTRRLFSDCSKIKNKERAARRIHKIDLDYYIKPLLNLPDLIVVQAVDNSGNFHNPEERKEHPMSCSAYPSHVRVGVFGMRHSGISPEGTDDISKIPDSKRAILPCVDMAVNIGSSDDPTDEEDRYSHIAWKGCDIQSQCCAHYDPFFGAGKGARLNGMFYSTSFAVPVALSHLIYLKNTLPEGTSMDDVIKKLKEDKDHFIKDPIRNRQIEVYRLGYLDS